MNHIPNGLGMCATVDSVITFQGVVFNYFFDIAELRSRPWPSSDKRLWHPAEQFENGGGLDHQDCHTEDVSQVDFATQTWFD